MRTYEKYGLKTKAEYFLGRQNRDNSLRHQFPDASKDEKGRNIWYKKNGILYRRES